MKNIKTLIRQYKIKKYFSSNYFNYALVIFSIILGFYLGWDITIVAMFAATVYIILNPIPGKLLAKVAMFFLLLTVLLLVANRGSIASATTLLLYWSLVMSAVMSFKEFLKEKKYEV